MYQVTNAETLVKLWLFEIVMPDGDPVRFAQNKTDVIYAGHTWLACPITHEGIDESGKGEIENMTIKVGNVNKDISALIELNDALRGYQVNVFQVFNVDDPDANIKDTYYVDTVKVGNEAASFTLATKFSILDARIAPRKYNRCYCRWQYKKRGCWLGLGPSYAPPPGFVVGASDTCDKSESGCKAHNNYMRFGGFPGVPKNKVIRV
jgi:lambda family phage minor tail protein L